MTKASPKADEQEAVEHHVESPDIEAEPTLRKAGVYYVWNEIQPGGLKQIHADVLLKHYLGPSKFSGPVQLVINSGGGDVDETNALIDLLDNVRFPVATAGFGTCGSAAAWLLACGTKGLRSVSKSCSILIHVYSWAASGNHHELVAQRTAQDNEYNNELGFWVRHSRYKTRADVEKYLLKKQDNWLTAKEALAHGIVDNIGGTLK